jgi:hypothetical protein
MSPNVPISLNFFGKKLLAILGLPLYKFLNCQKYLLPHKKSPDYLFRLLKSETKKFRPIDEIVVEKNKGTGYKFFFSNW